MKLLIRWVIMMIALFVAAWLLPGIHVEDTNAWIAYGVMAAVLALVNAIIRPILSFLSCGCLIATLGLFSLVINAFTFWLSSWIAQTWLGVGFYVDSVWSALLGGIVVGIVSVVLSLIFVDDK